MTENKFLNSLIVMLVISIIAVVYYWINQNSHGYFSFTVSDAEIGQYSSFQECIEEEWKYHKYKLNDDLSNGDGSYSYGNCDWKK